MPPLVGNIIVIAVLVGTVFCAARSIWKSRRKGGHCGGCEGCNSRCNRCSGN